MVSIKNKIGFGGLVILILFPLFGCTSARKRDQQNNLYQVLKARDYQTIEYFDQRYRSGNIYLDYGTALTLDVIFKDLDYRKKFLAEVSKFYYLAPKSQLKIWQEEQENYQNNFEFLLFVYGGNNRKLNLQKKSSEWKIFLKDDEGDLIRPGYIKKLKKDEREILFLGKYFYQLDRWSEVYRVKFPKLDKSQEKSNSPMTLIISGIRGKSSLIWKDSSIFYQHEKPENRLDNRRIDLLN